MAKKLVGSNTMPGGRVREIPIEPSWVRLAPGSAFRQTTLMSDTTKFTLSLGLRFPVNPTTGSSFLQFGAVTAEDLVWYTEFTAVPDTAITYKLHVRLISATLATEGGEPRLLSVFSGASPHTLFENFKYHVFISADLSQDSVISSNTPVTLSAGKPLYIYVNGVDAVPVEAAPSYVVHPDHQFEGTPMSIEVGTANGALTLNLSGTEFAFPTQSTNDPLTCAVDYSNIQFWTGTFINPEGTGTGKRAKDGQPPIVVELVDGANAKGLDPLIMLTFFGIETEFGLQRYMFEPGNQYKGAFQFNQAEISYAAAQTGGGSDLKSNSDQLNAYNFYYTSNIRGGPHPPWSPIVAARNLDDPTGIYHYLVHNQGPGGMPAILNAVNAGGTASIGSLGNTIAKNMLAQTRWASGLTTASTVGTWWTRLQNVYNSYQTQAAAKLTNGDGTPNIQFFYKDGLMRLPTVAQDQFNISDVLLWGATTDFINGTTARNDGLVTNFTVVNPSGVTDVIDLV